MAPASLASVFNDLLTAVCSNLSASQTLIIDCLVTPTRLASLSRPSTIQAGKSTLTLFCSARGRRAFVRSNESVMSLPSSNFRSKVLALIQCHLFFSRPSNRDQSDFTISVSNYSRPVFLVDNTDCEKPWLVQSFRRNFQ